MKLVLAAPLYPPDIGGPSYYALALYEALTALGHEVTVVRFGDFAHLPSGIRHVRYAYALVRAARHAKAIIALDVMSAAVPAVAASMLTGLPLVVRTGGDFVWEQYVERTGNLVPITHFYAKLPALSKKEQIAHVLTGYVVRHAHMVFSTPFQRDIWVAHYRIPQSRVHVIENAYERDPSAQAPAQKNFLAFGRNLVLKNMANVHEAFAKAMRKVPHITLETGQVSKEELREKLQKCYAVIVASVSEISPNMVLDALSYGKPFILTQYSGYADRFEGCGLIVDPLSVDDITQKIVDMAEPQTYSRLAASIQKLDRSRSYAAVARDFIALIQSL